MQTAAERPTLQKVVIDLNKVPATKVMKKIKKAGLHLGEARILQKGDVTVAEVDYYIGGLRGYRKTMTGVAICHDNDTYNPAYGLNLALA